MNNNRYGIYLEYSSNNNTLINNIANNNSYTGIYLEYSSNNNMLAYNIFCSNSNYDIYDDDNTPGYNNTCDTTYNYNDEGMTGCAYACPSTPPPAPPSRPSPSRNHPPVIIDYNPKDLYIKMNLSEKINEIAINFYVKAKDEDNDNLILEFFVNNVSKKICDGKGIVECSFLFTTNKGGSYSIKGIAKDEKKATANIEWKVNVFNVTISNVTISCIDEWNCSEWSDCVEGWRYRTCYKLNPECKSDLHKPEEKIPCEEEKPEEKPYKKAKPPILWPFIIIIAIAILLIFLFWLRLRKKDKKNY